MPSEIEVSSTEIADNNTITINQDRINSNVVDSEPLIEANLNTYVVSSTGAYSNGGSSVGNTPQWLADAINNEVSNGNKSLTDMLTDLSTYARQISNHVNQEIIRIDTESEKLDALITTVKSESENKYATIENVDATTVTEEMSKAWSTEMLVAEFNGDSGSATSLAAVVSLTEANASESEANSISIDQIASSINDPDTGLTATSSATDLLYTSVGVEPETGLLASSGHLVDLDVSIGDVAARLATEESVSVGTHIWDGEEDLLIGMRKEEPAGTWYTYMGGLIGWLLDTRLDASDAQSVADQAYVWAGGASSLLEGPDGEITGWSYSDGSEIDGSQFVIAADKFKVRGSGATSDDVFTVNGSGEVTFNGRVTFSSSNTNINTTNNLIPTYTWDSTSHDDYTFIGTVGVGSQTGVGGFSEMAVTLDSSADEVYSPYVVAPTTNDLNVSYAFKGGTIGTIYSVTEADVVTTQEIPMTISGFDNSIWYMVQFLVIRSSATIGTTYGIIKRMDTFETVGTIDDIRVGADDTKVILGFIGSDGETIQVARPAMEGMSADVQSIDNITSDTMYSAIENDTTVIDGGRITTGTIDANRIGSGRIVNSAALNGDGSVNENLVTMDINLNEGSIYIK